MLSLRRAVAPSPKPPAWDTSSIFMKPFAPWEDVIIAQLLRRSELHADETGFCVAVKTQWLHVVTDEVLNVKRVHPKRGRATI